MISGLIILIFIIGIILLFIRIFKPTAYSDLTSPIPYHAIEKIFYIVLSITEDFSSQQFIKIFSKNGLIKINSTTGRINFTNNKNFDSSTINVDGFFNNNKINFIAATFSSCISIERIKESNHCFSMYDSFLESIVRKYGPPLISINDILRKKKIPLVDSEMKAVEYRLKLIYSNEYFSKWENGYIKIDMKMTPNIEICICFTKN